MKKLTLFVILSALATTAWANLPAAVLEKHPELARDVQHLIHEAKANSTAHHKLNTCKKTQTKTKHG